MYDKLVKKGIGWLVATILKLVLNQLNEILRRNFVPLYCACLTDPNHVIELFLEDSFKQLTVTASKFAFSMVSVMWSAFSLS